MTRVSKLGRLALACALFAAVLAGCKSASTDPSSPPAATGSSQDSASAASPASDPGAASGAAQGACDASSPVNIEAREGERNGTLEVEADGENTLSSVSVAVKRGQNAANSSYVVQVKAGTVFLNGNGGGQNMVVTEGASLTLGCGEAEISMPVDAACIDMHKDVPSSSDSMTVDTDPYDHEAEVAAVLQAAKGGDNNARQMAVWIVRSNPQSLGEMPFVSTGLGEPDQSEQERRLEGARKILAKAGLDPSSYAVFQSGN